MRRILILLTFLLTFAFIAQGCSNEPAATGKSPAPTLSDNNPRPTAYLDKNLGEDGGMYFSCCMIKVRYTNSNNEIYFVRSTDDLALVPATLDAISDDPTMGMAIYDKNYFTDHSLVVIDLTQRSGSNKVNINSVEVLESKLVVKASVISSDYGTADMAQYRIFIELFSEDLVGVETAEIEFE